MSAKSGFGSHLWPPGAALTSVLIGAGLAAPAFVASDDAWDPSDVSAVDTQRNLETVTIVATGVSSMDAASSEDVSQDQLASQPLLRPGAVLENVPGLIVTQHSGEGKADQYFLRAFNLDHGTDLSTEVDGMPVNMLTHAHGQGYTDLNFLIPESSSDSNAGGNGVRLLTSLTYWT